VSVIARILDFKAFEQGTRSHIPDPNSWIEDGSPQPPRPMSPSSPTKQRKTRLEVLKNRHDFFSRKSNSFRIASMTPLEVLIAGLLVRVRADLFAKQFTLLREEASLPDDWDGDGALAVTGGAAAAVGDILFRISRLESWTATAAPDNLVATADGGLFLDWDFPHERLELFIGQTATLTVVIVTKESGYDSSWSTQRGLSIDEFVRRFDQSRHSYSGIVND